MASGLPRNQKATARLNLSRRVLLLVVLFVIIVLAVVFFLLRGSGSSTAKPATTVSLRVSHTDLARPTSTLTAQQLKIRKQDVRVDRLRSPDGPNFG